MKQFVFTLLLGGMLFSCTRTKETGFSPVDYADPQIGSVHGRWFFYTPAAVPFGMAKLAPHTNAYGSAGGWGPCGYDDRHTSIEGFGHFHEFQIGGVVFMPVTGEVKTIPGSLEDPDRGYRSRFSKTSEVAEPGYYAVFLDDYGIKAELTATERVGFHRYTFPETTQAHLLIDIGHRQGESGAVTRAWARQVGENEVEGYVETYPEYAKFCDPGKTVKMYFVARMNKTPKAGGAFVDSLITANVPETEGTGNGIFLSFDMTEGEMLEIKTGLSYTSLENARLNLLKEAEGVAFDQARQQARKSWNSMLGRIKVEGGDSLNRVKFYTGLYHALLGRGVSSDVNGAYPMVDGAAGQTPLDEQGAPLYRHFNTDGIWGGFWNLSQLWALAYPDYFSEYIRSNIDFYTHRGWLHDGEAAGVYTNGVQTNFQGLLIASAYHCGLRDFDVETGYEAALKNELDYRGRDLGNGKYDLHYFVNNGYVPYKDTIISNGWVFNFGGSHTLEYAFSSYAVAEMAQSMGKTDDAEKLYRQAGFYRNLFDKESGYIRPKTEDGEFIDNFDPMRPWDGFQEGNAFQYTWYVPHDVTGLIKLIGRDTFNSRLEEMFENAWQSRFGTDTKEIHSFSGVGMQYNHGNQPSLHNAWLFNYSGKPWLTQKWTRAICNSFYGTEPLHGYGIGQDEDQGQLGAWFVMAALGLFDVQGHASAEPSFQFGSPLFDQVTIQLHPDYYPGKKLVIKAENLSNNNIYVDSVTFNGEKTDPSHIDRNLLMNGGTLVFQMAEKPNLASRIAGDDYFGYVKDKALEIIKTGFTAGDSYGEVWIRDYNTFIELSAQVIDHHVLRENLLVFFRMQGEDGNILDGFIPKEKAQGGYDYFYFDLEPRYAGHKNTVETDQESSLVQAVYKYITITGDTSFLNEIVGGKEVSVRLDDAMQFLLDHRYSKEYGLITGATTADWGDVQPEHEWGVYLTGDTHYAIDIYDNAMFLTAVKNLMDLFPEKATRWQPVHDMIFQNVREHLWDESASKFIPHVYLNGSPFPDDFNENEIFYHGGTAVAIEAGLLSKEEIRVSLDKMVANMEASGAGSIGLTLYPPYPEGYFKNKGMYPYGYQNGGDWTWFGARMIQQLVINGFAEEAYTHIQPMVKRVKDNQGFFEWYTVDNKPKGSGTFRGEAGVLYKAITLLEESVNQKNQ